MTMERYQIRVSCMATQRRSSRLEMRSRMRFPKMALAASVFLVASGVLAGQCKTDPEVTGACFVVHGRMYSANGGSVARIWRIGTKRILGVTRKLPASLSAWMEEDRMTWFTPTFRCAR